MHRPTDTYADPTCPVRRGGNAMLLKPRLKVTPAASLSSRLSGGFLLPVLVVCAALWVLLSGARLI